MKLSLDQVFVVLFFILWLCFVPAQKGFSLDSGCVKAAENWILQLNDKDNTEIYQRHTRINCQFSGQWVKESQEVSSASHRKRMCQDLVLIWSHKNCNYFRDVINPDAFEPCSAWSREMYQHCIDNDVDWFQ
ncbi:MAG: hypothetical protein JXQ81_00780 [Desulfuromonadales bacterium]|nr:hypothetical protein [Desulfuromonadales bacterium]MBN2791019.1 hypothetical protein [Desulfuromonadales bacterium]